MRKGFGSLVVCAATARMILPALMVVGVAWGQSDIKGFVAPTAAELAMTSAPGHPGAAAVVLYRDQVSNDNSHQMEYYVRIKVLTEAGKEYSDVQIRFTQYSEDSTFDQMGNLEDVSHISGRTIHADGTIVPFTGKPYLKTVENLRDTELTNDNGKLITHANEKLQQMVFTLPDVQVGSILEYRYTVTWGAKYIDPPEWYLQGDIPVIAAHYRWYPSLDDSRELSWFSILPKDAKLDRQGQFYDLTVHDVPPLPSEHLAPPLDGLTQRVLFDYTYNRTTDEYWKSEGHDYFEKAAEFTDPDGTLKKATAACIGDAATDEDKLRKIYALVMTLENTEYTREHSRTEEKATGSGKVDRASDVLERKSGSSAQIAKLFAAMVRAAGMKPYLMLVPDRSRRQFNKQWLSFRQLDGLLVIVQVGDKEEYFDPGSRYVPYGHLDWKHTGVEGLRETRKDAQIASTPGESYDSNKTIHVGNLTVDEHGGVSGTIDFSYTGAAALRWRQQLLRSDDEQVRHELREALESMLPKTLEVSVLDMKGAADYEKPLLVKFDVKGQLGSFAGKRLLLPADLFRAGDTATFPEAKRDLPVYFHYPEVTVELVRMNFPQGLAIEAAPSDAKYSIKGAAVYSLTSTQAANSITVRRDFVFNQAIFPVDDYSSLREFYSQFEAKDKDSLVLKATAMADGNKGSAGQAP